MCAHVVMFTANNCWHALKMMRKSGMVAAMSKNTSQISHTTLAATLAGKCGWRTLHRGFSLRRAQFSSYFSSHSIQKQADTALICDKSSANTSSLMLGSSSGASSTLSPRTFLSLPMMMRGA